MISCKRPVPLGDHLHEATTTTTITTGVARQKEEKEKEEEKKEKEKKEEEKKFLRADGRVGTPIEGSTRGPRGLKKVPWTMVGLLISFRKN